MKSEGLFHAHVVNRLIVLTCLVLSFVTSSHSTLWEKNDIPQTPDVDVEQGGKLVLEASCSDYPSCELNLELLKKAMDTRSMKDACGHARASFQCQMSATNACEKEGVVNKEVIQTMKRAYIYTEIFVQEICHRGSSPIMTVTKGGSHCSEFRSCFTVVKRFKEAAKSELYNEACSTATFIYECSTSAMLDCRRRGSLSTEALDLMKNTTTQAGLTMDNICAFTTTTISPSESPSTFQCFDFAKCPQPDLDVIQRAKRTGQFEDACRTVTPYAKCQEEAIRDCEDKRLVTGIALKSMEESLRRTRENVRTYCPFYGMDVLMGHVVLSAPESETGSVPTFDLRTTYPPVQCLDIGSCPRPTIPAGRSIVLAYQEACKSMKIHTACIEYATNDCKVHNLISGSQLESMEKQVTDAKEMEQRYCLKAIQEAKEASPDHTTTTASITCLEMDACPKPKHLRDEMTEVEEVRQACGQTQAHASCIDQATNDCKVRNLITGSALESMMHKVKKAKQWAERYCSKARELSQDQPGNSGTTLKPDFHRYIIAIAFTLSFILHTFNIKVIPALAS